MRVVVSRRARRHLAEITGYIRKAGAPEAAYSLGEDLKRAIGSLADVPERLEQAGPSYGEDLRRMVVRSTYLVFYRVLQDRVQVVAVRDGRRAPGGLDREA